MPAHHLIEEYLEAYLEAGGLGGGGRVPLFQSARGRSRELTGRRLGREAAWRMIRRRAKDAGIAVAVGNHTFRATGITAFMDNGGRLEDAAAIAAHESTRTTMLHDRTGEKVTLDEIERVRI